MMLKAASRILIVCIVVDLITARSLWAANPKKTISEIAACLDSPKIKSKTCERTSRFLKKEKAHTEKGVHFLEHEWHIRRDLKSKGLELPNEVIPVAYSHREIGDHALVVIADWSYGKDSGISDRRQEAEWFSYKSGMVTRDNYWDGGSYNKLHVYIKKTAKSGYELLQSLAVTGEPVLSVKSTKLTWDNSFSTWFKTSDTLNCAGGEGKDKEVFFCLSNFWSKDWPEIHYWEDVRASTGLVLSTHLFVKGTYTKINADKGYFYKAGDQFAFAAPPSGEGYNDKWSYASPAAVMILNADRNSFERSDELTSQVFPVIERRIGTAPGDPVKEGYYLDKKNQLYRFVESAP